MTILKPILFTRTNAIVPGKQGPCRVTMLENKHLLPEMGESIFYIHGWQPTGVFFLPFTQHNNVDKQLIIKKDQEEIIDFYKYAQSNKISLKSLIWEKEASDNNVLNVQKKLWDKNSKVVNSLKIKLKQMLDLRGSQKSYRLVGHSLGAQVAILLAYHTSHIPEFSGLKRITLLDPAFVKDGSKSVLDETIKMIRYLKRYKKIHFECFQSSEITSNDLITHSNHELYKYMTYVKLKPRFIPFFKQAERHSFAKSFYFLSFLIRPKTLDGYHVQNAQSSLEETHENEGYYFEQTDGIFNYNLKKMIFSRQCKFIEYPDSVRNNSHSKN